MDWTRVSQCVRRVERGERHAWRSTCISAVSQSELAFQRQRCRGHTEHKAGDLILLLVLLELWDYL